MLNDAPPYARRGGRGAPKDGLGPIRNDRSESNEFG